MPVVIQQRSFVWGELRFIAATNEDVEHVSPRELIVV